MRIYNVTKGIQILPIGKQGENDAVRIRIDVTDWINDFGSEGTWILLHQRKGDAVPYPVSVTFEGNSILWNISNIDNAKVGEGRAELQYFIGNQLAKSITYKTVTFEALGTASPTPPEPYEDWVQEIAEASAEAIKASEYSEAYAKGTVNGVPVSEGQTGYEDNSKYYSEQAEASAERIGGMTMSATADGTHKTNPTVEVIKTIVDEHFHFALAFSGLRGNKGDKGDKGNPGLTGNGISDIAKTATAGLVDTYTIYYTDGFTDTFTVTNGAKGDPGNPGQTGNGIASITKTSSVGLVDTYTILYTNGGTDTFTVTNGQDGSGGSSNFFNVDANCDVAGAWTATIADLDELKEGLTLNLYVGTCDPATSGTTTLNVNGLGAYGITLYGNGTDTNLNTSTFDASKIDEYASTLLLIFDGVEWIGTILIGTRTIDSTELSGSGFDVYPVSAEAVRSAISTLNTAISAKQNASGNNSLTTTDKTIVGAINEVDSIAKGATKALSFANISSMVADLNGKTHSDYNVGQSIFIGTLDVPDVWISKFEASSVPYIYTTDDAFVTALKTDGYVQCGYIVVRALETQKVDLTDYYTKAEDDALIHAEALKSVYIVSGNSQDATGIWTGSIAGFAGYSDGLTILYRPLADPIPWDDPGSENPVTTLNISDGEEYKGAKPIFIFGSGIGSATYAVRLNTAQYRSVKGATWLLMRYSSSGVGRWNAWYMYGTRTTTFYELESSTEAEIAHTAQYPLSTDAARMALVRKENVSNKVTSISSSSTNTQYPSAKAVNDFVDGKGYLTSETDPTVPAWAKSANPPTYTKSDVGLGNVDNVKQYSASNPPPYPVTSVNGSTGAVVTKTKGTITLTTSWSGSDPYTQTVTISGVTNNSKIDLQPDATTLAQMMTDGVKAMYAENNNGTVTVYAIGSAPTASMTIQYTREELG